MIENSDEFFINLIQTGTLIVTSSPEKNGTLWLPVPAFVLSMLAFLCLFDESEWDKDMITPWFLYICNFRTNSKHSFCQYSENGKGNGYSRNNVISNIHSGGNWNIK